MHRLLRTFWNLAAVGGAVAVGVTTANAGFTALTFVGGLIAPRMLGLAGPVGPFGRGRAFGPGGFGRGRRFGSGAAFGPGAPSGPGGTPSGPGGTPSGAGWWGACSGSHRGGWGLAEGFDEWHRQAHQAEFPTPPSPAGAPTEAPAA